MNLGCISILATSLSLMSLNIQAESSTWYLSADAGKSHSLVTKTDLDREIISKETQARVTDLDKRSDSWAWHLGYQVTAPFAVELGYLDVGNRQVTVSGQTTNQHEFYQKVAQIYPKSGSGVTFASSFNRLIWQDKLMAKFKFGYFFWQGSFESFSDNKQLAIIEQSGKDEWLGVSLDYLVDHRHRVSVNYRRVKLNRQSNNLLTLGISYHF